MGRAFEYRKETKLKRWGNMARVFTKLVKQITIAVKEGGSDPDTNPRLRVLIQQSKKENMPKENIEKATKKAISKEAIDYKEIVYEGYGPFGVAIIIETVTDNPTRTVANIRSYFNKYGGSLGIKGSVRFLFEHKCVFKIESNEGMSLEKLELELIDFGVDEVEWNKKENVVLIYSKFQSHSAIQNYLEKNHYEIHSAEFERIPTNYKAVTEKQQASVEKLLDKFEEDRDIQNVYHNMK